MPARSQRSKNNDVHRDLVSELIALVFPALHVTTATLDSYVQYVEYHDDIVLMETESKKITSNRNSMEKDKMENKKDEGEENSKVVFKIETKDYVNQLKAEAADEERHGEQGEKGLEEEDRMEDEELEEPNLLEEEGLNEEDFLEVESQPEDLKRDNTRSIFQGSLHNQMLNELHTRFMAMKHLHNL